MSIATLHNEKKKTLVPQLRFKGFDGEWELNKLGEVAQFKAGYAFKSEQMLAKKSNYQLLKMSNVYQNELRLDRNPSFWKTIDTKQKEFLLKKGDSILTLTGTVGKKDYGYSIKIEDDNKYLLNQRLVLLREIQNKSDNGFINYLISTEKFLFYFFGEAKGGTGNQTNVSTEDVKNIKLNIPTLSEQQKIASFLSAVDEKIQQLSRKKELLEQYKKGVMQQLFSGKLRFKDENGKNYPDWEKKKISEIARIAMGQSPDSKSYNTESKGILLIQGNADIKDRITIPRQWTSEPTKICEIGDLILTVRAPVGSIAKSLHNACIGRGVCSITNNKNSIQEYLYQFFLSYESKWIGLEQGSTFTAVSGSDIKGLKLNLPSLPEQQKIATFLSNIDAKIESTNRQINQMQSFKKGLLQQLFV